MAELPHFAFPFHLHRGTSSGDTAGHVVGKVHTVEQDTQEHVMSCENVIVRCPYGFRVERPEFGIYWPEYRNNLSSAHYIADALMLFESRSRVTTETIQSWLADETLIRTSVEVLSG